MDKIGNLDFVNICMLVQPAHDKTNNRTGKDSDKLVHPPSIASILAYPSSDNSETAEGTCDQ